MALRDYQVAGAEFLRASARGMMLAPVGAGKTATVLTAMAGAIAAGQARRFLVLAPKRVAQSVWATEAALWAPNLRVVLALGTPAARTAALRAPADVVVTNYDCLQWLAEQPLDFDAIVFDELTRLKNASGKRFKALEKVIGKVDIRWGLTGSFTSNGLEDVFGQCKMIDKTLLGRSKGAFLQQYFYCANREYGEWHVLPGSLASVMARIKPATYLLEPGDYSDTLPPAHTVVLACELADKTGYEAMRQQFVLELGNDAQAIAASAAAVTSKLQQMASGFVYAEGETHWLSDHKLDRLAELLAENQRAPTIIVYNYRAELAALQQDYGTRAITLDAPNAIERWNAGEIELLLVHPKSAGHGLNLQAGGCRLVFFSLPWSLELYEQTIGRLHRSGQRHAVWVYVLVASGTIDDKILTALRDKKSVSDIAVEALK
jgi:SNF2-related domain/Helicase conserved C-terminal domain